MTVALIKTDLFLARKICYKYGNIQKLFWELSTPSFWFLAIKQITLYSHNCHKFIFPPILRTSSVTVSSSATVNNRWLHCLQQLLLTRPVTSCTVWCAIMFISCGVCVLEIVWKILGFNSPHVRDATLFQTWWRVPNFCRKWVWGAASVGWVCFHWPSSNCKFILKHIMNAHWVGE